MNKTFYDHTFVICAYKESKYLEQCITSLNKQTVKSNIICTTSTPNNYIENICKINNIPLIINPERNDIATDWNFAFFKTETSYVTLVHQDDIYEKNYLEEFLIYISNNNHIIIFFSNYYELRNNKIIKNNKLLYIKRIFCLPWRINFLRKSRFIARRIFMFCNPICCPSVTFNKNIILNSNFFISEYKTNCDWLAWIHLRDLKGDFLYCPKMLVGHRIHNESETTKLIANNTRNEEDFKILKILSPLALANIINKLYSKATKSNNL